MLLVTGIAAILTQQSRGALTLEEEDKLMKVLQAEDLKSIEYRTTKDTIESAVRKIQHGEITSFLIYSDDQTREIQLGLKLNF